ncbi:MAG: hypothetical protein AAGC56_14480 [Pseudomonadota bacterium]
MQLDELIWVFLSADFGGDEALMSQIGLFMGAFVFFVLTMALAIAAARAAQSATAARAEARALHASAETLTAEMRSLAAQAELSATGARSGLERAGVGVEGASVPPHAFRHETAAGDAAAAAYAELEGEPSGDDAPAGPADMTFNDASGQKADRRDFGKGEPALRSGLASIRRRRR